MTRYTPEQAKADALAGFKATGSAHLNCCQAVVRFALLLLDADADLVTAGRYFGGGIASMGEACGAITGSAMALGIRDMWLEIDDPELEDRTREKMQEFIRDFRAEFGGTCRCRELTGFDVSDAKEREAFFMSEAHDRCPGYVGFMCDKIVPLLLEA
jgi:C_GCAxxG_C_C family probable redox protein